MDWITNKIAIGNFRDAEDLPAEITAVLCLKDGCFCSNRTDVDALQVPLVDGAGNRPKDIAEAVEFIRDMIVGGGRILVHCHAGRSRSVVIVARHLMAESGMTAQEALTFISVRREICVSEGLRDTLALYT